MNTAAKVLLTTAELKASRRRFLAEPEVPSAFAALESATEQARWAIDRMPVTMDNLDLLIRAAARMAGEVRGMSKGMEDVSAYLDAASDEVQLVQRDTHVGDFDWSAK